MLLTFNNMFNDSAELHMGEWSILTTLEYSIEALRFLNEIVQYEKEFRPFPDQLMNHPYFNCDVRSQPPVKRYLKSLLKLGLTSVSKYQLTFNSKDPIDFC